MLFFALNGSVPLGQRIAEAGGFELAEHEEREFDGGEHKARPLVSVRGRDVFVLHELQGGDGASANDRLLRLLFFLATCRENGAARVTAISPYLAYSRKDRQTKPRDPVTTRYVAGLFESVGANAVITLDVHNIVAFQNAFRCQTVHLSMRNLFAGEIARSANGGELVIASPDPGGVKRAQLLREAVEARMGCDVGFAMMEKRRSAGVVTGTLFAGDVEGATVHLVDDMICGGGTIRRAAAAARERGATEVHAHATHGLLSEDALRNLFADDLLDSLTLSDSVVSVPVIDGPLASHLKLVSCAPLIAGAIRSLNEGGSLSEAIDGG